MSVAKGPGAQTPGHRGFGAGLWNKQRKDEILIDVEDVALGHETRMRWNDTAAWVWSQEPVHEALVTIEIFEAAQATFAQTRTTTRPHAGAGATLLTSRTRRRSPHLPPRRTSASRDTPAWG